MTIHYKWQGRHNRNSGFFFNFTKKTIVFSNVWFLIQRNQESFSLLTGVNNTNGQYCEYEPIDLIKKVYLLLTKYLTVDNISRGQWVDYDLLMDLNKLTRVTLFLPHCSEVWWQCFDAIWSEWSLCRVQPSGKLTSILWGLEVLFTNYLGRQLYFWPCGLLRTSLLKEDV